MLVLIFASCCIFIVSLYVTEKIKPVSFSVWVSIFLFITWSVIVVISESIGRFSYKPYSMGCCSLLLGALALWRILHENINPVQSLRNYKIKSSLLTIFQFKTNWILSFIWIITILFSFVSTTMIPPMVHDVISYHIPIVAEWSHHGKIQTIPHLNYHGNYFPHNVELLNSWVFLFTKQINFVGIMQVILSGILWPLTVYVFLRKNSLPRQWAAWGAVLSSATPQVVQQMSNELVDVGFMSALLFSITSCLSAIPLFHYSFFISGLIAGLALGSKSSGIIACFVIFLFLLYQFINTRSGGTSSQIKSQILNLAVWATGVLITGIWVYGINLIRFGNPVYPFPIHLGPLVLPSPDMIHMANWMHSGYGDSPISAIFKGLSMIGALFLGLPPNFNTVADGQIAGYGPLFTVMLFIGIAGWIYSKKFERKRLLADIKKIPYEIGLFFGITVLFLVFWDHQMFEKVKLENSSLGRYLLYCVPAVVLFYISILLSQTNRIQEILVWLTAFLAFASIVYFMESGTYRGWKDVKYRLVEHKSMYDFYYRSVPPKLMPDQKSFFSKISPSEPVIIVNHSFINQYPFYWPDFSRDVYTAVPWGPYQMDTEAWDLPLAVTEPCKKFIREERIKQNNKQIFLWGVPAGAFDAGIPYIEALAKKTNASVVISIMGDLPAPNSTWTLLWREPQKYIAVYRVNVK